MKKLLFSVLAFLLVSSAALAQKQQKATIAVMPFIIDESVRITIGNQVLIPRRIETEFTSEITEFLVKSRKFNVLERDYLRKVLNENKITESEWVKPGESQRIGQLLVADYIVIGYIDRLDFVAKRKVIELTGEDRIEVTATFKIHFRITEVKSGKIVFAQGLTERLKSEDVRKEIPYQERKDWTLADFKDYLFDKTSTKAGNLILEGIYPIKIASVQNGQVMLNRGEGAGITVGKIYQVFNVGQAVKDPDTGEILGTEELLAGTIQITSVHPKFSKGKIISAKYEIKPGDICRSQTKKAAKASAPAYPRKTPGW